MEAVIMAAFILVMHEDPNELAAPVTASSWLRVYSECVSASGWKFRELPWDEAMSRAHEACLSHLMEARRAFVEEGHSRIEAEEWTDRYARSVPAGIELSKPK